MEPLLAYGNRDSLESLGELSLMASAERFSDGIGRSGKSASRHASQKKRAYDTPSHSEYSRT